MPFLQFTRQAVPEFGEFLLEYLPAIDRLAFFRQNEQYFLRQLPGYQVVKFFGAEETGLSAVPDGLWEEAVVRKAQVYLPTATVATSG
jgi:leucyl-tRNA synthetase